VTVHLVRGSDPLVLRDAVTALVDRLVGDDDRSLLVDELSAADLQGDDAAADAFPIVSAAQTPPFLTDRRIVVVREAGVLSSTASAQPLIDYLADPLETSVLVIVWEKGPRQQRLDAVPKKLLDAVKKAGGEIIDSTPPTRARDRQGWVGERVAESSVSLTPEARARVATQLGEDVGRLGGMLRTLEGAYGPGARLDVDDIEPFLGDSGGVATWDLTDAISSGDIPLAIDRLHRLLEAGERHPVSVLYTLHGHYQQLLALEGADVADARDAAALLNIHEFRAEKALAQTRRLGHEGVAAAIDLLGRADLDLRGGSGLPADVVLEVLVARLAQRARARR
jgi:DNA polymerase-3 subunit delta